MKHGQAVLAAAVSEIDVTVDEVQVCGSKEVLLKAVPEKEKASRFHVAPWILWLPVLDEGEYWREGFFY